ncbi:MAG: GNAT family N-acetyltransferase [Oligoflexia bacterium]|nr:GNAT family N-acetyltransferase [Oligoflexia bacterium]
MKIRNPNLKELPYIIDMVSKNLGYNTEEGSVLNDFPLVYKENNLQNLWVLENEGQICSHLAVYPSRIKIHAEVLSSIGVGGVVTDLSHRGKGYSSKLMTQVLECYENKNDVAIAVLWSNLWEFYSRFSFFPSGNQIRQTCRVDLALVNRKNNYKVQRKIDTELLKKSYDLFKKHSFGNIRTEKEHLTYLEKGSANSFFLLNEEVLLAYILIDKGKDLKNYIHEWAGSEESLKILLDEVLLDRKTEVEIISPVQLAWANDYLKSDNLFKEVMGLIKILNKSLLVEILKESLKEDKKSLSQALEASRKTDKEFLEVLFGGPSDVSLSAKLPIWYWGMDSI